MAFLDFYSHILDHKLLAKQSLEKKDYKAHLFHSQQLYKNTNDTDDLKALNNAQKLNDTYEELQTFLKIPKDDYYKILDVTKSDLSNLRENYKKLTKKFHPDKSKLSECNEAFHRIQNAYQTLSDENKRNAYNRNNSRNFRSRMEYNMFFYEMARRRNVNGFEDFESVFRPEYYVYRRRRREQPEDEDESLNGIVFILIMFILLFISMI